MTKYDDDGFRMAFICPNGHVETNTYPDHRYDVAPTVCRKCGLPLVSKCPHCGRKVPGLTPSEAITGYGATEWEPPTECENCLTPFPWKDKV